MNNIVPQASLRTSYQLQAAQILSQHQSLSNYFALKAIDSKTYCLFNKKPQTHPINNVTDNLEDASLTTNHTQLGTSMDFGSDFICPYCGLHLSPGHFGTTVRLRTLHRGSTRRRRASRYRAIDATSTIHSFNSKSAKKQRITNEWKSITSFSISDQNGVNHYQQEQLKVNKKFEHHMKRVTDGEAINSVIYKCGKCNQQLKFKGIPISSKNKQKLQVRKMKSALQFDRHGGSTPNRNSDSCSNPLQIKPASFSSEKQTKDQRKLQKKLGSAFVSHSFASKKPDALTSSPFKSTVLGSLSGDFIPLGSKSTTKASRKQKEFASPLLELKKRKRKRAKSEGSKCGDQKKSQIMDFLASLND